MSLEPASDACDTPARPWGRQPRPARAASCISCGQHCYSHLPASQHVGAESHRAIIIHQITWPRHLQLLPFVRSRTQGATAANNSSGPNPLTKSWPIAHREECSLHMTLGVSAPACPCTNVASTSLLLSPLSRSHIQEAAFQDAPTQPDHRPLMR